MVKTDFQVVKEASKTKAYLTNQDKHKLSKTFYPFYFCSEFNVQIAKATIQESQT